MKIKEIKTFTVGVPPPFKGGMNWVFIKLITDEGIEGWGECNSAPFREKTIAQLAEAHYAQITPWMYCGSIAGAAAIQLDVCSPNFLMQEGIEDWGGFTAEILKEPIIWKEGYIIPPSKPGWGVEINEKILHKYPFNDYSSPELKKWLEEFDRIGKKNRYRDYRRGGQNENHECPGEDSETPYG